MQVSFAPRLGLYQRPFPPPISTSVRSSITVTTLYSHHQPHTGPRPQLQIASVAGMILLAAPGLYAFCNDKVTDCANWAKDGECQKDNTVRAPSAPLQLPT